MRRAGSGEPTSLTHEPRASDHRWAARRGMTATRRVLLMVPDLFFVAKIQTAAAHLGVVTGPTRAALLAADCASQRPDLVIVDLHGEAGALDAVRALKRDAAAAPVRVVGFYSHVDDATRRAAPDAGIDEVP